MNFSPAYRSPEALLHDFRSGNQQALKVVYNFHYHALWSFANRILKDGDAAEDIIAESFIKLWERRMQMESIKGMIAYLYTIIRHACLTHLSQQSKMEQVHEEARYLEQFNNNIAVEEYRSGLIQLILLEASKMPKQMQTVFSMAYLEGMQALAIADKLSVSIHTVQTQKKRALKRLRLQLSKKGILKWSYFLEGLFLASFLHLQDQLFYRIFL
jgi:RNA polymerase sigma-70 factor (family 1)